REAGLRSVRTHEGGPADTGAVDRTRGGTEGRARRLRRDRRGHRRPMGATGFRRPSRRLLHPATGHRGGYLAHRAPGSLRLVVRRRAAAVRRDVVTADRFALSI